MDLWDDFAVRTTRVLEICFRHYRWSCLPPTSTSCCIPFNIDVIPRPMRPRTVDKSISLDDLQHFSIPDVLGPNVVFGITIYQLNTIRLAPVLCLVRYNTVASADRANIEEIYQCNS